MIRDSSTMDRPVERPWWGGRRTVWLGGALLAAVALAAVLAPGVGRWMSSDRVVDASRIRIGTVTRGDLVRDVDVQGSVVAAFRPTLTSPASGVARVEVRPGETVARGQVLVRVESPEVDSRLAQERSALASLAAELDRERLRARQERLRAAQEVRRLEMALDAAERALDRAERTREMGLTNEVEYETARDELEVARMRLELARQEAELQEETVEFEVRDRASRLERQRLVVAEVERQVAELAVRSPVDGLVSRVEVADRDSVTAGEPLVGVVDLSGLELEIQVPESYAADIGPGVEAVVAFDGKRWPGRVKSLSPEVEGSRVRGVVEFAGAPPPGLKQGQRLPARLLLETRPDVLKVPRGPFLESGGGRQVYVVEDGTATLRAVETGAVSVSEVEIVSGLDAGEEIVLSDVSRFDGAQRVLLRD